MAAAAYRAGDLLRDERYGVTHNYVGKRGIVRRSRLYYLSDKIGKAARIKERKVTK